MPNKRGTERCGVFCDSSNWGWMIRLVVSQKKTKQGSAGTDHPRPAQLSSDANLPTTDKSSTRGVDKLPVDFVHSGRICLLHLKFLRSSEAHPGETVILYTYVKTSDLWQGE